MWSKLVDDLEQFKSRVKNLEIATVDGVAVPMEDMNHEIDALINKINKNSEMFLQNKPLYLSLRGGRSVAVIKASKLQFEVIKQNVQSCS